jgi:hypothetical protein
MSPTGSVSALERAQVHQGLIVRTRDILTLLIVAPYSTQHRTK